MLKIKNLINKIYYLGYLEDITIQIKIEKNNYSICFDSPDSLKKQNKEKEMHASDVIKAIFLYSFIYLK